MALRGKHRTRDKTRGGRVLKKLISALLAGMVLSACNSTENVLKVDGSDKSAANQGATAPAIPTPPMDAGTAPATNVAAAGIRMRFAPIIGAPVDKVTPLSRRLNARARAGNVEIVASNDPNATHVLKGYFSVLGEGQATTVVYVFDILDTSGNRLHRIQGQEVAAGSNAADPWGAVPATLMEAIADKAMTEFMAWTGKPAA
jgi:hypothetical protein